MLKKMIVAIVLLILIYKGIKILCDQLRFSANMVEIVATQNEVNHISQLIYSQIMIRNNFELLQATPEEICHFIRGSMASRDQFRDACKDMWNTPYRIREINSNTHTDSKEGNPMDFYNRLVHGNTVCKFKGFEVVSAGPDGIFDTEDDIKSCVNLQ